MKRLQQQLNTLEEEKLEMNEQLHLADKKMEKLSKHITQSVHKVVWSLQYNYELWEKFCCGEWDVNIPSFVTVKQHKKQSHLIGLDTIIVDHHDDDCVWLCPLKVLKLLIQLISPDQQVQKLEAKLKQTEQSRDDLEMKIKSGEELTNQQVMMLYWCCVIDKVMCIIIKCYCNDKI